VLRRYLILIIALSGTLSAVQLGVLVVDYADSTASANMIVARILRFQLAQAVNGSLSAIADLDIQDPARVHVNITYVSYQLIVKGEYVTDGSRTFFPNLMLNAMSSVDLHVTLDIPVGRLQVVLKAPKEAMQMLLFITTKTSYGVGILRFTLQPEILVS